MVEEREGKRFAPWRDHMSDAEFELHLKKIQKVIATMPEDEYHESVLDPCLDFFQCKTCEKLIPMTGSFKNHLNNRAKCLARKKDLDKRREEIRRENGKLLEIIEDFDKEVHLKPFYSEEWEMLHDDYIPSLEAQKNFELFPSKKDSMVRRSRKISKKNHKHKKSKSLKNLILSYFPKPKVRKEKRKEKDFTIERTSNNNSVVKSSDLSDIPVTLISNCRKYQFINIEPCLDTSLLTSSDPFWISFGESLKAAFEKELLKYSPEEVLS